MDCVFLVVKLLMMLLGSVVYTGCGKGDSKMRRHKIGLKKSRKMFTRHAMHPHPKNFSVGSVMRGGIRL